MQGSDRKYFIVMILCFLYAGFALLASVFLVYSEVLKPDISQNFIYSRSQNNPDFNYADKNSAAMPVFGQRIFRYGSSPILLVTSPVFAALITSGAISFFAGLAIWSLTRRKEINAIKQQAADNLLLPDEKKIIELLKASDYELTQSKLAKESGLGKVQVHRAIKRLELKGIIEKHNYGLTNKILLKKEIFE